MLPLCIPGIGIKGVVYTARNHEGITTNDLVDRFPTGSLDCVSIERGVYTTAQYTNVPYEPKQQTMLPPPPPPPPLPASVHRNPLRGQFDEEIILGKNWPSKTA